MQEQMRLVTFTALRVTSGVVLAAHGWQKLTALEAWQSQLADMGVSAPNVMAYLAIAGEFLGGVGLILGVLTPLAALGTACTSAAAIVLVHWGKGLFAQNGGFEYPLILLMISLLFMAHGGGALSVDASLRRARRTRAEKASAAREGHAPGTWHESPHVGGERQYR